MQKGLVIGMLIGYFVLPRVTLILFSMHPFQRS